MQWVRIDHVWVKAGAFANALKKENRNGRMRC